MDYKRVILQAILSFVVLFLLSKILGKKQVAQLEFNDYVIGISIGSIAAQMAIDPDVPYYHFIIAMVIFAVLDYLISIISRRATLLKSVFKGKPLILIEAGKFNYSNLKKSKLDLNEVMSQCRIQGYFDLGEIAFCIFETSGNFSILPKSHAREIKAGDLKLPKVTPSLSNDLVVDGQIVDAALKKANKNQQWLFAQCKITNKKQLKNILLATYNSQKKEISLHFKNSENSLGLKDTIKVK